MENRLTGCEKIKSNWYVFYTRPRAEKVVYQELINNEYRAFLPLLKTLKVWKNRQKKWIDQVLFPGYIFVETEYNELFNITKIPKVVCFIQNDNKPSIIRHEEILAIKKMLNLDNNISIETNFNEGERVRIAYGPLAGHEGILIKQKGKTRFGIQLKEINQTVFIDISTSMLEKQSKEVELKTAEMSLIY